MNHIDNLLNSLNNMVPLSSGLWNDLPPMMVEKRKKSGSVLLKQGNIAAKAWQLISGYIVAFRPNETGREDVTRIYYPKQIVTDLKSFFEETPIHAKYVAVGDVHLLEIKKSDVIRLRKYPEVNILIQRISFADLSALSSLTYMIKQSPKMSILLFLNEYLINGLPHKYCASLLNLPEDVYIENILQLEKEGLYSARSAEVDGYIDDLPYSAYKIKGYLRKHYKNPDFGNTDKIAAHFNTTTRSLNRMLFQSFGLTATKFILKLRMEKALILLNTSDLQIGEVAVAVGYKDRFHFSSEFKKYYGQSPKSIKNI